MTEWTQQTNRWVWTNSHVEIILYEMKRTLPELNCKTYITRISNKDLKTEKVYEIYAQDIGTAKILAAKYAYTDMNTVCEAMQEGMYSIENYLRIAEKSGET